MTKILSSRNMRGMLVNKVILSHEVDYTVYTSMSQVVACLSLISVHVVVVQTQHSSQALNTALV